LKNKINSEDKIKMETTNQGIIKKEDLINQTLGNIAKLYNLTFKELKTKLYENNGIEITSHLKKADENLAEVIFNLLGDTPLLQNVYNPAEIRNENIIAKEETIVEEETMKPEYPPVKEVLNNEPAINENTPQVNETPETIKEEKPVDKEIIEEKSNDTELIKPEIKTAPAIKPEPASEPNRKPKLNLH